MGLLVLAIVWLLLLLWTFRAPNGPRLDRLFFFLLLVVATGLLAFQFAVKVLHFDPDPWRVAVAHRLVDNKFIDLANVAQGVSGLRDVHRIDADKAEEDKTKKEKADTSTQEWLVFYRYDVVGSEEDKPEGPIGAAIYGLVNCRPPAILSYELVPVGYSYLAESRASVEVANIIEFYDPQSMVGGEKLDRPEVIINGYSREAVVDLNIFRKVGVELNCHQQKQWQVAHPGEAFPNPIHYENVGSFHGSYLVRRSGNVVTVVDRSVFERSQIVVEKEYGPKDGSYFRQDAQTLLEPAEVRLTFGPGEPADVSQVYYPEKAVLAFYLALTKNRDDLERASSYLSDNARRRYPIQTDSFGISMPRSSLDHVVVWEIGYSVDVRSEQLRQPRSVEVTVVGVGKDAKPDPSQACRVVWNVIGVENEKASPYGCEWRLDGYQSNCQP